MDEAPKGAAEDIWSSFPLPLDPRACPCNPIVPKRGLAPAKPIDGPDASVPCVSNGECLEKGLAAPDVPMANRLDPMLEEDGGTARSDPSDRFKMLFGLAVAFCGDESADGPDFEGIEVPTPPLLLPMLEVGMWRASGNANREEKVGECSTEATPGGGDWTAAAECACALEGKAVVVFSLMSVPEDAEGFLLMTGEAWLDPVEGTNSGLAGLRVVVVEEVGSLT